MPASSLLTFFSIAAQFVPDREALKPLSDACTNGIYPARPTTFRIAGRVLGAELLTNDFRHPLCSPPRWQHACAFSRAEVEQHFQNRGSARSWF